MSSLFKQYRKLVFGMLLTCLNVETFAAEIVLKSGNTSHVNLVVKNVCDYYGNIVVCNGSDSLSIPHSIGTVMGGSYTAFDSLQSFNKITTLEVEPEGIGPWFKKYLYVGDSTKIQKFYVDYPLANPYDTTQIYPQQFFYMDSITAFSSIGGFNYILKSTSVGPNFFVLDTSLTSNFASLHLNMLPKTMYCNYNQTVYITGEDALQHTKLSIISPSYTLLMDTVLPSYADNVKHLVLDFQNLTLVCSPGDSCINIVKYNLTTGALSIYLLLTNSGIHASEIVGTSLVYQPEIGNLGTNDEKKLFDFDLWNLNSNGPFLINKRLKLIKYPDSNPNVSFYPYINLVEESINPAKVYQYSVFNYLLIDSFSTSLNPDLFIGDFRCPVGIKEYDDSQVKFETFPNPASNLVNIESSGLICGRNYELDICDVEGKIKFKTSIHSKMTLSLPVETLAPGMYFIRIHTLKGIVIQKIIKE